MIPINKMTREMAEAIWRQADLKQFKPLLQVGNAQFTLKHFDSTECELIPVEENNDSR